MCGFAMALIMVLTPRGVAAADPEVEALKQQVQELQKRIERIESGRTQPATSTGDAPSLPPVSAEQPPAAGQTGTAAAGEDDATGTDPRAFGTKFMPYFRFERLESNVEVNSLALFGLVRINDNLAWTYELPISKEIDYGDAEPFKMASALIEGSPGGGLPNPSIPFTSLDSDGDTVGMGDLGLRLFYKNECLRFDSPLKDDGSGEWMLGFETIIPTATEDVLGGESWIVSPLVTLVMDTPLPYSFMALMNFYDIDVNKDNSRGDVSRFRGRWFYMQPLSPPGDHWYNGVYLLPEFQPVYDFENDEFSFWIGPELGKIVAPGRILYAKPGWGIDTEVNERDFTFEVGLRWFFD
jgi:hypothetical protein